MIFDSNREDDASVFFKIANGVELFGHVAAYADRGLTVLSRNRAGGFNAGMQSTGGRAP